MHDNILFRTDRLELRHLAPADEDALYTVCSKQNVMQYVGNAQPLSREQVQTWIRVSQENYVKGNIGANAVILAESNTLIGYCGIVKVPGFEGLELIYGFDEPYWGKGYATEISRAMILHYFAAQRQDILYASIDPDNKASEHILKKLGFCFYAETPDQDGLPTHYYRLLRRELPG